MIGPNLSEWAVNRRSLIIYLMLAAVFAGALSFINLGRNEDPAFTFRTMVVQAAWPGASLEDTVLQVTERIERRLQDVPGLDHLTSYTRPGRATIFVNLLGDTAASDVPDRWYDVRKKVGDIRGTLPQGVVGPGFNDEFGDVFGIIYGFTSDGFTHRELRDHVEDIRSQLLEVPDVSKIEIIGAKDEQILLEFSTQRLAALELDYPSLVAALQAQNAIRPAGILRTGTESIALRVSGTFDSELDILAINFAVGDRLIRLGDIADVRRIIADPPQPMFRVNGQAAIGIGVAMQDGGDILALGQNIGDAIADIRRDLPIGIEPVLVADQAVTVDVAINEFTTSLWQAILIIMAASFLSLGIRPGLVVALAIPLTLATVFPIMETVDIDLQRISLGALIIALALLVDDAMTTVDAMLRRLAAGDSKAEAATFAYRTLAAPMLIGTLVTIAGFIPVGFAASAAGEYTFSIFAVVGIALIVSWLVAVIFAPLIGMAVLKVPPSDTATSAEPGKLIRGYRGLLIWAMRLRWLTIAITAGLFVLAVFASQFVPRQFFPASDRPELIADVTLPHNASIYASEDAARKLDEILSDDPDVERWSTYVGRGAVRFYLPLDVQLASDFFSQAVIVATDVDARQRLQEKLDRVFSEEFPDAVSRTYPLELGPPVGWPLQYRVSGENLDRVRDISLELAQLVSTNPNVRRINFDWNEPSRQVRMQIQQDELRRLGLSSSSIAAVLNAAISGTTVTQIRDGIYLVDVVARATEVERMSLQTLRSLQVPTPSGRTVPIGQFATFEYGQEYPLVWRRDRVPTLTVRADVATGVLPEGIVEDLAPAIDDMNAGLPKGYDIAVGGIAEESAKSRASVFAVVPLMLLIMLTVLMFFLQSFKRLLLVIAMLPLGLIGVVGALLAFGQPLGFVAILGILALIGMIAKNAVILITQIEADRESGLSVWDAVLAASSSRVRPMSLTALSTILGLIPIAPTVFWGPMAFAIMGGLLIATLLTLIFLPAAYAAMFGAREPA